MIPHRSIFTCTCCCQDPYYQLAFVLLLKGQCADSIEACHNSEERAPGWFHCRETLWLAEQLLIGKIEQSVIVTLAVLDEAGQPPKENVRVAKLAIKQSPEVASLYLRLGINLINLKRQAEAEAAFRQGLSCIEVPELETRLCVNLATVLAPGPDRNDLLQRAQDPAGNLVSAAMARLIARQFSDCRQ